MKPIRAAVALALVAITIVACQPAAADPDQLANLHIAPNTPLTGYSRAQFGDGWTTQPGGCNTRDTVLRTTGQHVTMRGHCTVTAGTWTSLYDGITVTNPKQLDIDHIVPLGNAWITGARTWTAARRQAFANDPVELVAVSAHSNRSKGDDAPPGYEPPARSERCDYAQRWVTVKAKYSLTITQREHDALAAMLGTCRQGATGD